MYIELHRELLLFEGKGGLHSGVLVLMVIQRRQISSFELQENKFLGVKIALFL